MFRITSNKKRIRIMEVLVFLMLIAIFLVVILILK
jgi:hypothetical protein